MSVFSGSDLCYASLDEMAFGLQHRFADPFVDGRGAKIGSEATLDMDAVSEACNTVASMARDQKRLIFVFLESTHYPYSWPASFEHPQRGFARNWDILGPPPAEDRIRSIKNRYLNAVSYIDYLTDRLVSAAERRSDSKIAVIFTGDHGEEFWENGRFSHGTSLNEPQTRVPLALWANNGIVIPVTSEIASHADILPTALELMGYRVGGSNVGISLISGTRKQATISANNGLNDPLEGVIQGIERAPLPDLSQRERGIVDQRTIERRDGHQWVDGEGGFVVPERLDHRASEEVFPPTCFSHQDRTHRRDARQGCQRADQRGPDELRRLGVQRVQQARGQLSVGIVLKEGVGDPPQSIVGAEERLDHHVPGAWIVEAGGQYERPISHVAIEMLPGRLQQRRHGLFARRTANRPRRHRSRGVIQRSQRADGRLELALGHRLRAGGFLRV